MKRTPVFIVILVILASAVFLFFKNNSKTEISVVEETESEVYINTTYNFSTPLYDGMTATSFTEAGGDTALLKSETDEMQIRITPFDEDIILTEERIKIDIPDIKMENPETISIGGIDGVTFISDNNGLKYREVWFVHGGYLYQTLSRTSGDAVTYKIMDGWKWL
jgi:uncharacterized protein YxeA